MRIHKIRVKNFRLLTDVEMVLEDETTVVVGRNNSGKTSLSEVIRRFLHDSSATFQIEDFSIASYSKFCDALQARNEGKSDEDIRAILPYIELRLHFRYAPSEHEFGPLSDFVIDLDESCTEALVVARFELKDGNIQALFANQPNVELTDEIRHDFFQSLRERIPRLYAVKVHAEDPNDPNNRKLVLPSALRYLLKTGFINAQRGLDDNTTKEADVLSKILEGLFITATSPTAEEADKQIAIALHDAIQDIQRKIDKDFNSKLQDLLPTFETFGYPGLGGPEMATETTLDVKKILSNYTKVRYTGCNGILLPESYNGLGMRNLILILLQIVSFYKVFRAEPNAPGVHLVFIEEPEAHLHPQMQEVFIQQLSNIAQELSSRDSMGITWPVQFIVSTHSSHIANAARFEAIRYFMATPTTVTPNIRQTLIKDLREGLQGSDSDDKEFLHQYLTLTRCDLFFADKAVLVEGISERILLPLMVKKLEEIFPTSPKLSSQYVTTIEVGGAYAHIFFDLLEFLELRTLIITDIDSVEVAGGVACPVHKGIATSNACLKAWFSNDSSPINLLMMPEASKIQGHIRIAFQRPEEQDGPCGRTFEDAFMLANPGMFTFNSSTNAEIELEAFERVKCIKKSQFALEHALEKTDWAVPGYITEGLLWLAGGDSLDDDASTINTSKPTPVLVTVG